MCYYMNVYFALFISFAQLYNTQIICYLIHNLLFFFFSKIYCHCIRCSTKCTTAFIAGFLQEKEYTRIIIVVVGHTRDACIDFMHHSLV